MSDVACQHPPRLPVVQWRFDRVSDAFIIAKEVTEGLPVRLAKSAQRQSLRFDLLRRFQLDRDLPSLMLGHFFYDCFAFRSLIQDTPHA